MKLHQFIERCAWCKKDIRLVETAEYEADELQETGGICQECYEREEKKLKGGEDEVSELPVGKVEKEVVEKQAE